MRAVDMYRTNGMLNDAIRTCKVFFPSQLGKLMTDIRDKAAAGITTRQYLDAAEV